MTQMTDKELHQLIGGCKKHDVKCQKMLYKLFYGFCMGICLRYAPNRDEAAQIMNKGFLMVFTNINKYSMAESFKAWIGRLMVNAAIDSYRVSLKIAYLRDPVMVEFIGDGELHDMDADHKTLLSMIQQLPNDHRIAFNLFVIDGFSHEEIGSMLNISPGISESNLHKARHKLRQMMFEANSSATTNSNNNSLLEIKL
jgi:RNA polymerase sigma factor (sigma-70 family)